MGNLFITSESETCPALSRTVVRTHDIQENLLLHCFLLNTFGLDCSVTRTSFRGDLFVLFGGCTTNGL